MADGALFVEVSAVTHRGVVRSNNQDSLAVGAWVSRPGGSDEMHGRFPIDRPVGILVADGMGGHPAGDIASQAVARRFGELAGGCVDSRAVEAALRIANQELYEMMRAQPSLAGMGTTAAGVVVTPDKTIVFNVGDSRVYRLFGRYARQVSADHTIEARTSRGASDGPRARPSPLTQSLGGTAAPTEIHPLVAATPMMSGQRFLVCSDGLTDVVSLDVIEDILGMPFSQAAASLVEAAIEAGAPDNVSAVLVGTSAGDSETEVRGSAE